jgi:hypothetical protein
MLVGVEPGDVAGRQLQVEDAHRPVLEHLPVMRLLVRRHDRVLPLPVRVSGLPGWLLANEPDSAYPDSAETDSCGGKCERAAHTSS